MDANEPQVDSLLITNDEDREFFEFSDDSDKDENFNVMFNYMAICVYIAM